MAALAVTGCRSSTAFSLPVGVQVSRTRYSQPRVRVLLKWERSKAKTSKCFGACFVTGARVGACGYLPVAARLGTRAARCADVLWFSQRTQLLFAALFLHWVRCEV